MRVGILGFGCCCVGFHDLGFRVLVLGIQGCLLNQVRLDCIEPYDLKSTKEPLFATLLTSDLSMASRSFIKTLLGLKGRGLREGSSARGSGVQEIPAIRISMLGATDLQGTSVCVQ